MTSGDRISVQARQIDGVDFTFVTHPDATAIRANVLLPFEAQPIIDGDLPHETPHLLEHIVCCGDGEKTTEEYKEYQDSQGGYTNAFTHMTINGRLSFETTQPDDAQDIVRGMFHSVFHPSLHVDDVEEQREIVRNELQGYLMNPVRQRQTLMGYRQGIRYVTDDIGLSTLDEIDTDMAKDFHKDVFTRRNARILLSGTEVVLEKLAEDIAGEMGDSPSGERIYTPNNNYIDLPDYHAPVIDTPASMTEYTHTLVSEGSFGGGYTKSELFIVTNALQNFIESGRNGLPEQSRRRGLSYGMQVYLRVAQRQIGITVADTTDVAKIAQQIQLLEETLQRATGFSEEAYREYRMKQLGHRKIYPVDVFSFAKEVEPEFAYDDEPEMITPLSVQHAYESLQPSRVVEAIQQCVERLQQPNFVNRVAFGANPF